MTTPANISGLTPAGQAWLQEHRARYAKQEQERQRKAALVACEQAGRLYRCTRGHTFARPDTVRCKIGCCPQCAEINTDFRRVPDEPPAAQEYPWLHDPLTRQEQAGKEMMERLKDPQVSGPGPSDADLWDMTDDLPPREEPGATEPEEQDGEF